MPSSINSVFLPTTTDIQFRKKTDDTLDRTNNTPRQTWALISELKVKFLLSVLIVKTTIQSWIIFPKATRSLFCGRPSLPIIFLPKFPSKNHCHILVPEFLALVLASNGSGFPGEDLVKCFPALSFKCNYLRVTFG